LDPPFLKKIYIRQSELFKGTINKYEQEGGLTTEVIDNYLNSNLTIFCFVFLFFVFIFYLFLIK